MIIVVEGASAAGKTTWCRQLPRDQTIFERESPRSPPPVEADLPAPAGPQIVAEYWTKENSGRWTAACEISERFGWVVCDTDPFKLHWAWTLWVSGLSPVEYWEHSKACARSAFTGGRLGLPDLVLFADPDIETLRRQKAGDHTRTRGRHEMHVRIAPALKRWYLAMAALDPVRVEFALPKNGLEHRHMQMGRREVSTGTAIFDDFMSELEARR